MLKRILTISAGAFFLVATTGFFLSMHFCGSRLVSMSVNANSKTCCGDGNGHCCHNEIKILKIYDQYLCCSQTIQSEHSANPQLSDLLVLADDTPLISKDFITFESPPPKKIQSSLAKRQTYLL